MKNMTATIPPVSFGNYLSQQKNMLITATLLSALVFLLLKWCYPLPGLFSDSNSYIEWANRNIDIAFRPLGYSRLLTFVHLFSHSATVMVLLQYLLFFLSSLFCFFSADHLLAIPAKLRWPIMAFMLYNPLLVLQANMISSDTIFSSLTVIWLSLLLWTIRKPGLLLILLNALILYLCIAVRYTALMYPAITLVAYLLASGKATDRIGGAVLTIAVLYATIEHQKDKAEELLAVRTFSGFTGWQLANNALYCYPDITIDPNDLPGPETRSIDTIVRMYLPKMGPRPAEVGSIYMWDNQSPLKVALFVVMQNSGSKYKPSWFAVSKYFEAYGWYIITHFPGAFIKDYIVPNAGLFMYPAPEALHHYNCEITQVPPVTTEWFGVHENDFVERAPGLQKIVTDISRVISLLLNTFNLIFVLLLLRTLLVRKRGVSDERLRAALLWGAFYGLFAGFIIFAAAVNLRFMDPIFSLGLVMPLASLPLLRKTLSQPAIIDDTDRASQATPTPVPERTSHFTKKRKHKK